jgi:hypothetical protein
MNVAAVEPQPYGTEAAPAAGLRYLGCWQGVNQYVSSDEVDLAIGRKVIQCRPPSALTQRYIPI